MDKQKTKISFLKLLFNPLVSSITFSVALSFVLFMLFFLAIAFLHVDGDAALGLIIIFGPILTIIFIIALFVSYRFFKKRY